MKKLTILLVAALAFLAMSCNKFENEINDNATERSVIVDVNDIDTAIVSFVATYFPQSNITTCYQNQDCFKVLLDDQTVLHFDYAFDWKKVDCSHSTVNTVVPNGIVPAQITTYVTDSLPGLNIVEINKADFGWRIMLDNNQNVKFDTNFNVINGNGNGNGNGHHGHGHGFAADTCLGGHQHIHACVADSCNGGHNHNHNYGSEVDTCSNGNGGNGHHSGNGHHGGN